MIITYQRPDTIGHNLDPEAPDAAQSIDALIALAREASRSPDPAAALQKGIEERFDVYQSVPAEGADGRITGYFTASIPVSTSRSPRDTVPIYESAPGRRSGLTRRELAAGRFRARVRYWTASPIDLMFFQTEGSGWGLLPDGKRIWLADDGDNKHRWHGLKPALVECGLADETLDGRGLRELLKSYPAAVQQKLADLDPSYVFLSSRDSAAVELVARRSVAVDPRYAPLGLPALLSSSELVSPSSAETRPFTRVVFTADVGGAIKGPDRVDYYWGEGDLAQAEADRLAHDGDLYVLLLKKR